MVHGLLLASSVRMVLRVLFLTLVLFLLLLPLDFLIKFPVLVLRVGLEVRLLLIRTTSHAGLHPLFLHLLLVLLELPRVVVLLWIGSHWLLCTSCRRLAGLRLLRVDPYNRWGTVEVILRRHALIITKMVER